MPNNWYANGAAGEGLTWANNIWNAIVNANVSAYLYWEGMHHILRYRAYTRLQDADLVLLCFGGTYVGAEVGTTNSALVLISGTTPQASKRLWAFAHFSRFVRPGALRISTSPPTSPNLKFSAFKDPDGENIAVQVINSGSDAQSVSVQLQAWTVQAARGFVSEQGTDFGEVDVVIEAGGGMVTGSVPGWSMVSFVLTGVESTPGGSSTTTSTGTSTSTSTSVSSTGSSGCTTSLYGQCGGEGALLSFIRPVIMIRFS